MTQTDSRRGRRPLVGVELQDLHGRQVVGSPVQIGDTRRTARAHCVNTFGGLTTSAAACRGRLGRFRPEPPAITAIRRIDWLSCQLARRMHGLARTESACSMRAMPDTSRFDAIDDLTADELRQRLRTLQALIASAPVPIAIAHDPDCQFISANRRSRPCSVFPSARNISMTPGGGSSPTYRIQRGGKDVPDEESTDAVAIAQRASIRNDIEIVRGDGSVAYVQNDVEPLYDTHGEVYGCVSVCVDLTESEAGAAGAASRPIAARTSSSPRSRTSCAIRSRRSAAPSRSCGWRGTSPTSSRKRARRWNASCCNWCA